MMHVLIVDDEPLARAELKAQLETEPDVQIIGECSNAMEAIAAIHHGGVDLVFLDIQMPRISGLELVGMLDPEHRPEIVFLTAHDEYAMRAFDAEAIDYLLKPIDSPRLHKTLDRLRHRERKMKQVYAFETQKLRHIPCLGVNRILLIKLEEVECVASRSSGIYIIGTDGKEHFTELTLKTLEERTPFIRCHKQFLINADQIREIKLAENGLAEIITLEGRSVPVSRRFLGSLKDNVGIS